MKDPLRFELERLGSYTEADVLAELRRVAALVPGSTLTRAQFDRHARVDSSTVLRRLGDWRVALERAGLAERYSGRRISQRMRTQPGKEMTDEQTLMEIHRVAHQSSDGRTVTRDMLRDNSQVSDRLLMTRFGSWTEALRRAGLEVRPLGRRWTDADYYENLLEVWTHHGRQPKYREMNEPPSKITKGAYEKKFGTWHKALEAFVGRVNADAVGSKSQAPSPLLPQKSSSRQEQVPPRGARAVPLGLRYKVLSRDRFRCALCGRSPATDLNCNLHVDHMLPVAMGGKTGEDNLRALCSECNLGKGVRLEPVHV